MFFLNLLSGISVNLVLMLPYMCHLMDEKKSILVCNELGSIGYSTKNYNVLYGHCHRYM